MVSVDVKRHVYLLTYILVLEPKNNDTPQLGLTSYLARPEITVMDDWA